MDEEAKTREQQYNELRKQKTKQYQEKMMAKRGVNPQGNLKNEEEFDGDDMERLERLNLDQKDEDQEFFD